MQQYYTSGRSMAQNSILVRFRFSRDATILHIGQVDGSELHSRALSVFARCNNITHRAGRWLRTPFSCAFGFREMQQYYTLGRPMAQNSILVRFRFSRDATVLHIGQADGSELHSRALSVFAR